MSTLSIGDLAQSVYLRRQNVELKTEMARLTSELSSGKVQDVTEHLGGDVTYLTDIVRNMRLNNVFERSTQEAASYTATMQASLGYLQETVGNLAHEILSLGAQGMSSTHQHSGATARSAMDAVISTLNTAIGGRSLFSGSATDSTALQDAETILADLQTGISGQSTLAGVEAVLDGWFDIGGGFDSVAYAGGADHLAPFQLGNGERIDLSIKADGVVFREALKAVVMAVLSQDITLGFTDEVRSQMLARSGELGIGANDTLTATRATLGHAQARIEEAGARLSAQKTSLEIARNGLLSADPYDTVVRLEETQFRLESLYTATSRLSQLSLVGFLG
jgi:flagellar hook-associated protein 3 FlgL